MINSSHRTVIELGKESTKLIFIYYFPGPGENVFSPKNGLCDLPNEFDKLLLNRE